MNFRKKENKIDCSIMYSRYSNEFKQNPRDRKNLENQKFQKNTKNDNSRVFEKPDKPKL